MKITPFRKQFASPTHFLAVLLLLSLPSFLIAQVQVTPATGGIFTPESLITNVFLGDGVEVTAVSFNGDPVSVGYFTDGAANLNIDRGILMTTGTATDAIGPNDATGNGSTTTNMVSDPDLNAISTAGLQDVSTYEITFIPTSDTLRFRYVFASEEYPEYACTGFNDVFGFFITGPNPAGGMYNAQNIARVPDPSDPSGLTFTNDPVTINMVNPGTPGTAGGTVANCSPPGGSLAYSQYYNASAANDPFMQYDGYLNAFVAQAIVIPCQTYTMKLGVADAGDTNFDTAVFLEAKSFGTGSLAVEATTLSLDGTITESCVEGTITFRLPNAIEDDYTIDYNIFGTATNGVDYATIPTTLTIPAGDTAVSFPLIAFEDGITEGIESIAFDVQRDPCNRDTFYVYIRDNEIVPPELGPDLTICKNDPGVQLDGTLPIVLPDPPTFTNSVGYDPIVTISDNNPPPTGTPPTIAPLQVFAVQPFTLAEGVIKSVCINVQHNWIDDIDIFLVSPGGQFLELTTDNGGDGNNYFQTCFTPDATVPINFPGPAAPASAAPFTGNFQPEGLWSDLYDGDNPTNGTWQLLIKDDQTGLDGRLFDWSMCFTPLYQVFYEWTPSAGLSCADCPDPIASPDTTTTYTLTAFDTYGCEVYDTITINVIEDLPAPILSCGTPTDNSVTVEWPPVTSATGYEVNVNGSGWLGSSGANSHTVSGLALNTCVDVEVRGVGSCDGLIDTITCCTPNCVPPVASIDALTNVNCFGGMDGTVDVSAMGNAFIAEYNLAGNTNTTGIFTGLSAGNYTVSITDQVMCTTQIDFTITQPDTLIVTPILIDSISYNGLSDGMATVCVVGGVFPYSYDWGTQTDSVAVMLPAGTATVTVTDANMCTAITSIIINEPDALSINFTTDSLSCNASGDGSATVLPAGGVGDYTYLWDANASGQTTATATNLNAGTYSVTLSDGNNCQVSNSITIFENPALQLSTLSTDASCNGVFNGTATVIVTGGAQDYSFLWNDPLNQIDSIATGLTVGTFEVTVTDADGCTAITSVMVDAPNAITTSIVVDSVSCVGAADGTASVTVNGGTPIYTYAWSDAGAPTPDRNDLITGNYQVTVTDMNSCFEVIDFTIGNAVPIVLTIDSTIVNCPSGSDGTATVNASGGTGIGTYSYLWSTANQTTTTATGLSAGIETVTVTDGNNCSQIAMVTITEQTPMSITTDSIPVNCFGESNGSITVAVTDGNGGYSYAWSPTTGVPVGDGSTYSNLSAGNYTVTVTDALGCIITSTIEVTQPANLLSTTSVGAASCDGAPDGTATVLAIGGVDPYEYLWSNGQTTATADNLNPTEYYVTVTDANACIVLDTINIASPPPLSIQLDSVDVSCNGALDGTATVIPSGGAGGYIYQWDDMNGQQTATATGLNGNTYTVTVSDVNACSIVGNIVVNEPTAIQLGVTPTNILCNGDDNGTIDLSVMGGEMPYSFVWSNGATTEDLSSLMANDYTVTVTDNIGCSAIIGSPITQPDVLVLSSTQVNIDCFNGNEGSIDLSVIGGVTNYNYAWEGPNGFTSTNEDLNNLVAGTYTVTVTDANSCSDQLSLILTQPLTGMTIQLDSVDVSCNGALDGTATVIANGSAGGYTYLWDDPNAQQTATATGLNGNTYTVTVTDVNGCSLIGNILVNEPTEIQLAITPTNILCNGDDNGTIDLSVMGGEMPYSFAWSNGATTEDISSLMANDYTVTVTDNIGCSATISSPITQPDLLVLSSTQENIDCYNSNEGSIDLTVVGGVTNYNYLWEGPNGFTSTSEDINMLIAGSYSVTVTDFNNCNDVLSVVLTQPLTGVETSVSPRDTICFNANTGTATVFVTGGTTPYNYLWDAGQTTATIANLSSGLHLVTVTDAEGCSYRDTAYVDQLEELTMELSQVGASCHDGLDGTASIDNILYGTVGAFDPAGFSISWNSVPVQTTVTATNLQGGQTYTATITDLNRACVSTATITIDNPVEIGSTVIEVNGISCAGLQDGNATVDGEGGTAPYTFLWGGTAGAQTNATAENLPSGIHPVQITDAEGCSTEINIEIIEPPALNNDFQKTNVDCNGSATGSITAQASGGTPPYTYTWSNGEANRSINALAADNYQLTITDQNGCTLVTNTDITQPAEMLNALITKVDVLCHEGRDGNITITATGGTPPYQYSLDGLTYNGAENIVGLTAGTYSIFVRDAKNCIWSGGDLAILEPDPVIVNLGPDLIIDLEDDAQLSSLVSNAVPPLSYFWSPTDSLSCINCPDPIAEDLTYTQSYYLQVVDANGCEGEDYVQIIVEKIRKVYVPTGFTPNNDGFNDLLLVHGKDGTTIKTFQLYDRWGELIFESTNFDINDPTVGWDGTFRGEKMNAGVYVWVVEAAYIDGATEILQGNSTLIR